MSKKNCGKVWTGRMDGYLKTNLDAAKEVIAQDWDMVFCVDGYEGTGKSVLAQQMAKYCDPSIDISRVCFTPEEFKEAINNAEKYQAIIFDEAYGGMSSRAAMSEVNKSLMSMLAEIRQKNLFVFLVLPCFFELDKYAAIWRSRALIHVYTGEKFKRGRFSFYSQDRKKSLYIIGKKFYSYSQPKSNFHGEFPPGYVVDEKAYRKKKLKALSQYSDVKKESSVLRKSQQRLRIACLKLREFGLRDKAIGELIDCDYSTVNKMINAAKLGGVPEN